MHKRREVHKAVIRPIQQRATWFRVRFAIAGSVRGNDAYVWWKGVIRNEAPGKTRSRKAMKKKNREAICVAILGICQIAFVG